MKKIRLDAEEKAFVSSYEKGEWKSVKPSKAELAKYTEYARHSLRKSERINIRLSHTDLEGIQSKAIEEGIPYQTLIASVLHKYVTGRLTS